MDVFEKDNRWLIFRLNEDKYAISCTSVSSLFQMPEYTVLQNYDENVNGVIEYQQKIIQLINLKKLLSIKTVKEEINEFELILDLKFKEHVESVNKLIDKVLNNNDNELILDYQECPFTKWYESFNHEKNSMIFLSALKKFERPHKQIHDIANKAMTFISKGENQKAIELINKTKDNELKQVEQNFDLVRESFIDSKKEIVVVFSKDDTFLSFTVDEVLSIEELKDIETESIENSGVDSRYIAAIAKRKNNDVTFILDEEVFFEKYGYAKV